MFIFIIILIEIVYIKNNLFYINPFLNILGYNFYQVEYMNLETNQKNNAIFFYKGDFDISKKYCLSKLSHENFNMIENYEE